MENILQQKEMYRDELNDSIAIPNHSDLRENVRNF